jgi:hypothetical protein
VRFQNGLRERRQAPMAQEKNEKIVKIQSKGIGFNIKCVSLQFQLV